MVKYARLFINYFPYIVRQMLIKRSQPQPAMKNAAAGGKRIATCGRGAAEKNAPGEEINK
jgi:hypothetical protein